MESANQFSPWTAQEFQRSIDANNRFAWVALEGVVVIGFAVYSLVGREAELLTLSIAPSHQGRGLGKQLLLDTLSRLAFETLFLEVRESNQVAICLYESVGFNAVGRRGNYYPTTSGREDAIIYAYSKIFLS